MHLPTTPGLAMSAILLPLAGWTAAPRAQTTDADLRAWFRFEQAAKLGLDSSANGTDATVTNGGATLGRTGNALLLRGDGGLEIAARHAPPAAAGFTLDCWVHFTAVNQSMNVVSRDGVCLLRLDPPTERSYLSFFVYADDGWEPRVRTVVPEPGTWYHVIAAWDGRHAWAWVNGRMFRQKREGRIKPSTAPLVIGGPSTWAPIGLHGMLDEFRILDRAMGEPEIIAADYGLRPSPGTPAAARKVEFTFGEDAAGWRALGARTPPTVTGGRLTAEVTGRRTLLVNSALDLPLDKLEYVTVRLAVTAGETGRVYWQSSQGSNLVDFPLKADGNLHTYTLRLAPYTEWRGRLRILGILPSDSDCRAELDYVAVARQPVAYAELEITRFEADSVILRARRQVTVRAALRNSGAPATGVRADLTAPNGVTIDGLPERTLDALWHEEETELAWTITAERPLTGELRLTASAAGTAPASAALPVRFGPRVELAPADYVPEPRPVRTDLLVGAHYCPLWKQGTRRQVWEPIVPWRKRKPVLGWYDEGDPEVADWEIKWCLEHGISFFVYCWYRRNQGRGVDMFLPHAIHEGLFRARYRSMFKFAIMWENQLKGQAGVASEADLLENLLPFWIQTYFRHPSYLVLDGKPLLFVYRPEYLIEDLGSVEAVRSAADKMRKACRRAGFAGLTLLGEYRHVSPKPLQTMVDEGLDYSFSYCWHLPGDPPSAKSVGMQEAFWQTRRGLNLIPDILTVSMGWDCRPWHACHSKWRQTPEDFLKTCERAKSSMAALPQGSLARRIVLLDNWNEFGEGHYIAPHREHGFGYLDAVRAAFADAPEEHLDLIPEDVGLGPYDRLYAEHVSRRAEMDRLRRRKVKLPSLPPGVVACWTFDEEQDSPVALDYSGNRLGGVLNGAARVGGISGKGLLCKGGCVTVPPSPFLSPQQITVECWIRAEAPDQHDRWFVNRVYGGGTTTGYRLGLNHGRLCWAVPLTEWSHHLVADNKLPVGAWVHVAATFDCREMRLYMDGKLCGTMARPGPVRTNEFHLCLGNYEQGHRAHFIGVLDEVRLYERALLPETIARHARRRGQRTP